jgi:hypothetical protein
MPTYRFRFLDKFEHVVAGQFMDCENDNDAQRVARKLLARGDRVTIQIWQGGRWVCRMENGGLKTHDEHGAPFSQERE